jgi:hypothetical protein
MVGLFSPQEMPFGAIFSIVQAFSMNDHAHAGTPGCCSCLLDKPMKSAAAVHFTA